MYGFSEVSDIFVSLPKNTCIPKIPQEEGNKYSVERGGGIVGGDGSGGVVKDLRSIFFTLRDF